MNVTFLNVNMSGGGAERVSALLLNYLNQDKGYDMYLITDTLTPFAYHVDLESEHIHPLFKNRKEHSSCFSFIYMVVNVRRYLKKYRPDILVCIMPWMTLVGTLAKIGLPVKIIASDHTSIDRPVHFHIRFIKKYLYPLADAVTLLSETDCRILGKRLPKKVVMPNPLSFPVLSSYEPNRMKNILAVGRLDVWDVKGFDLLIQAWAKICRQYPDWKLQIAGTGSDKSIIKVQNIAKDYGVTDQFELLGFRKDIDVVMRNSSIFALTSRIEGFGMVLIEAMSQGCACVSFDNGGRQKEIIRNDNEGFVIENYDIDELAEKLSLLICNHQLRESMAKAGINRANDYNITIIAKRWVSLFEKLLKD